MRTTLIVTATVLATVLAAVPPAGAGAPEDADAIVGLWRTAPGEDGAAIIEIVRDGDRYRGTIVWLEKPVYGPDEERPGQPKVDLENPDPKLRERPVLGLPLLEGFVWNARKHRWEGGTIYDPSNGKTYRCHLTLKDHDTLKVRGYIGFSMLGRTEIWHRVDRIPGSGSSSTAAGS